MDERYLSELFGNHKGYVAVASKAGEGKSDWTEKSFLWPNDRQELVAWVDDRKNTDLFICPALRRSPGRRKNDGAHLQWLWADVDFQDIDPRHHEKIRARVQRLGNLVVWSGSGQNCHVYVKLDRVVHLDVWRRLNLGLKQALMADTKHTDNALLRIPGTQNYKPGGKAVRMESGRGVIRVPARLLKAKPWRDVVVTDEPASDGTWERVELPTIPGGVRARVNMEVDEGVGRYGTRHAAVYQVTAWLSKRGYTSDQIHTLMADFKPGLDKEDSERGYDLHQDISRCLAQQPTREVIDDEGALAIAEESEYFEEVEPVSVEEKQHAAALKLVERYDTERRARQLMAQRDFKPPDADASFSFADMIGVELAEVEYAVDGIAALGQNVSITGQYKTGKTMLACNLIRSFCDHTSFLDEMKVRALNDDERVGFWSLEMSKRDLLGYLVPQGFEHPEKLSVLNGRGYGVNILTDVGRAWAVNWLRERAVGVWVIDSWARICRMVGVDENDNTAVGDLTHRLDQIKLEAGVSEIFILAHTPRALMEEGRERARGAAAFDDWADSRWVFTKDAETRFLQVDTGREIVPMPATSVMYDTDTKRMSLGTSDKTGARISSVADLAVQLITEMPPRHYTHKTLITVMRDHAPEGLKRQAVIVAGIEEAVDLERIRTVPGPGRRKLYELVPERKVNGARATARVMNFRNVSDGPRRKRQSD